MYTVGIRISTVFRFLYTFSIGKCRFCYGKHTFTYSRSKRKTVYNFKCKNGEKAAAQKNCKIFLLALVPPKKGSVCCLISFLAEGEGFALQRLPIGYAEGAIACSPGNAVRCPGFEHLAFFKNSPLTAGKLFWRSAYNIS